MDSAPKDYLKTLRERKKASRVYRSFQAAGLELSEILNDKTRKSLYIKLAKLYNAEWLIGLAKDIASRKSVRNKGAYFMSVLQTQKSGKNKKG